MEKELNIRDAVVEPLGNTAKELRKFKEKYAEFQLQLITIAGATFSIYLAFGKGTSSNLTKWGFIFLAVSLICGLLSVILRLINHYFSAFYKYFDIERSLFQDERWENARKNLAKMGYDRPVVYDKNIDENLLSGSKQTGIKMTRSLLETETSSLSSFFGIFQLVSILIATGLLLIGLLITPIIQTT